MAQELSNGVLVVGPSSHDFTLDTPALQVDVVGRLSNTFESFPPGSQPNDGDGAVLYRLVNGELFFQFVGERVTLWRGAAIFIPKGVSYTAHNATGEIATAVVCRWS